MAVTTRHQSTIYIKVMFGNKDSHQQNLMASKNLLWNMII